MGRDAGGSRPRPGCEGVHAYLRQLDTELAERQRAAELTIRSMGISFTVYAESGEGHHSRA